MRYQRGDSSQQLSFGPGPITPGVKLSASMKTPFEPFVMEPYLSLSYPLTKDLDRRIGEPEGWVFPESFYLTLGFRFVFRG